MVLYYGPLPSVQIGILSVWLMVCALMLMLWDFDVRVSGLLVAISDSLRMYSEAHAEYLQEFVEIQTDVLRKLVVASAEHSEDEVLP